MTYPWGTDLLLFPECYLPSSIETCVSIISLCNIQVKPFTCVYTFVFKQDLHRIVVSNVRASIP